MSLPKRAQATPASIMAPRILLIVSTIGISVFGLMMIWSATSVSHVVSDKSSIMTASHQLVFVMIGLVGAVVLALIDYHLWCGPRVRWVVCGAATALLLLVIFSALGHGAYGATRWINFGSFSLQPSEFAKVSIVLMTASLCQRYVVDGADDTFHTMAYAAVGIGIPVTLIFFQPDKGTTMIMGATVLAMVYLAGFPGKYIALVALLGTSFVTVYAMQARYSNARIVTMFDPYATRWSDGYQIVQGWLGFGTGGILGTGVGSGRMKYGYLPFAHNDFILPIIGEETGLLGCLCLLAAFCVLVWAGLRIARQAPDLTGRLIAAGGVLQLGIQTLVNVCGVLAILPMTGKPIPFVSYGGSSVVASFLMIGLVCSVSLHSELPETAYEERRSRLRVVSERPVSALRVHEGGLVSRATDPATLRSERDLSANLRGRVSVGSNGMRRIDLGRDATERLRGSSSRR